MQKIITRIVFIYASLLTVFFTSASAQDRQQMIWSIYGAYNLNIHNAQFNGTPWLPVSANSVNFGLQMSHGFSTGGRVSYSFPEKWQLSLGIGYSSQTSDFLRYEQFGPVGLSDGSSVMAISLHRFSQATKSISIEPGISYPIIEGAIPFYLQLGAKLDVFLEKNYTYQEELLSPTIGVFADTGQRQRNFQNGLLPLHSPLSSISAGVEAQFSIMNLKIQPNLKYYFPLTAFIVTQNWSVSTLQTGFAVVF